MSHPVHVRDDMASSRMQPTTGASSVLHHQNGLPTRLAPTLPSFKHLAEVADQSTLQYLRAPSVGCDYFPVPLIGAESTLVSPPESVASPTPTPSRSVSPVAGRATQSASRSRRQNPSYRVGKTTKSSKRKNYSDPAKAQEIENNRRIEAAQRPYKEGVRMSVGHHPFPYFDHKYAPCEAKRAKSSTGSSDPNTRHNMAQTHLRAEKGGYRMGLQRLLLGPFHWKGLKMQTVVNAKSSGLLYEEKDILQGGTHMVSFALIFMHRLFGQEGMQQLSTVLDLFEPEDVGPAEVVRDERDDDKTYELKCQAARIQVIEQAHLPLGLKHIRSRDELLDVMQHKVMPIANDFGKSVLQEMFFREPRENRARL